ncbi:MAG: glyoxalase, partial [Leptospiraceae bacterium]|nr:glyoxalase [Leptospiraceae bacterium]
ADAWWKQIQEARLSERFSVQVTTPENQPWGMRDFCLTDPSGVLWRIANNM